MAEYTVRAPANKNDLKGVLGDAASSDFVPRLKFSKWSGEVEFGIEHDLGGMVGGRTFSQNGNIYTLDNARIALNFYPLAEGYEFELILKRKPATNTITLPISWRGVRFLYQPPLTAEWTVGATHGGTGRTVASVTETEVRDEGGMLLVQRPANVVGSYAVYHATKRDDYTLLGGHNYGTGKVCHIYRPQLTDALGATTWATLDINTTTNRLTITAPQAFLDTATYPVTVDPDFGEKGYGAGADTIEANAIYATKYTSGGAGTVASLSCYCAASSGTINLQLGIYTTAATPARVDYTGSESVTTSAGLHTVNGTLGGAITATDYWLCANGSAGWSYYVDSGSGADSDKQSQEFGTWPATLTSLANANAYDYSIYCTYTEGASATNVVRMLL